MKQAHNLKAGKLILRVSSLPFRRSSLCSRVTQDFPFWRVLLCGPFMGRGAKLHPTPCPILMNGLFVGLWKQAESFHLPPYGQAYRSPVAWGHSEHLPLPGCTSDSEAPTGRRRCFCLPFSFHFYIAASCKPSWTACKTVLRGASSVCCKAAWKALVSQLCRLGLFDPYVRR